MIDPYEIGPNAPYRNPPIHPEYYMPSRFVITAISEGVTTTITTQISHNYVIGQEIRLLIPPFWGSPELNNRTGIVYSIPSETQVTININSLGFTPFNLANPAPQYPQIPSIIAIGDINTGAINSHGRCNLGLTIPGAFRDISPL